MSALLTAILDGSDESFTQNIDYISSLIVDMGATALPTNSALFAPADPKKVQQLKRSA